jgi:hypothetical protein
MSDNTLPYLADVAITKLIANADLSVDFAVNWNVASIRPDLIQIYTQFGSESQLADLGNLRATVYADQSPFPVQASGSDNDTFLFIGVAPRTVTQRMEVIRTQWRIQAGRCNRGIPSCGQMAFKLSFRLILPAVYCLHLTSKYPPASRP